MDLKQSQRNQLQNSESGGEIYADRTDRRTMAAEKCILPPASSLLYPFEHANMVTGGSSSSSGSRSNFSNSPTEVTDEQYVQSILDVTDIGLVVYSILDARVLFWNRAAKQMFGYDDDSNLDYHHHHHHHYSSGSGSQGGGHMGGHGSRTSEKVKMVKRWMDLLHPQYIPLTDAQLERRVFDVKCSTEMQTTEIYANLAFENIETGAIAECLSVSTGFVSRGYAVMEITFRDHLKHEQRAELLYEESAPSQEEREQQQQQQDDVQPSQRTYQTAQVQELGQSPQQHHQHQRGHYEQQKSSPPITSSSSSSSASTSHHQHHQHRNQSHGETHYRDHRYPFMETQYGRQQQQQSSSIVQSPVDSSSSSVSSDAGTSTVTQSPMLPSFDEGFRSSASSSASAVVATAAPPPAVMHHHQQQYYQSTTTATTATTPLHHHHRDGSKPTLQYPQHTEEATK